jgi:hypothetical protein
MFQSGGWTEVKSHKRPRNPWMPQSKCEDLERKLNIRNLAKTLMSQKCKELQASGYNFEKVVSEKEYNDLLTKVESKATEFLPTFNKWKDWVMMTRKNDGDDDDDYICMRCGAYIGQTDMVMSHLCSKCR